MGDNGSVQMGLNSSSSGMNTGAVAEKFVAGLAMNSGSTVRTSHGGKCFYSSGLDPIGSLSQSENFGTAPMAAHGVFANPSYPVASENRDMNDTSHLAYYSSDPHVEMVPKIAVFGDGNYSEMVNPFGLPGCGQNYAGVCPEKYSSTKNMPTDRALVASPNGKRKRVSDAPSPSNPFKTTEGDPPGDLSGETSELKESDEKKQNNKQTGKQVKDISQDGEASKGNDIHVRARRGQATNSHSLAERVRREKISERMRLLQELVPGCSKITGKAVMLDEIINYVQSLQQQVEFLSMKLATVNPELNFNIEQILSKDILHLQRVGTPSLGFNPVSSSSHPYALGIQGALLGISNASTCHHTLAQGMWDSEMQGLFHMGLNSNPVVENLGPNGRSKPEP